MTEWLGDHTMAADTIRVFIIFVGFTITMIAVKMSLSAARFRDWERFTGILASACFIVIPSLNALLRFGEPLRALPTVVYMLGLLLAIVSLGYRVTLWPSWKRPKRTRAERRARKARAEADSTSHRR